MSVWLRNFQSKVLFNEYLLKLHSVFLLHALGAGRFGVSVVCVDGKEIRELNRAYRNEDSSTDVLSFPYHEVGTPGTMLNAKHNCSSFLRAWFQVCCRHQNETATATLGISFWGHLSLHSSVHQMG